MKKISLKIAVCLLSFLFMAETTGLVIFVHTCTGTKSKEISLFEKKSCCCGDERNTESSSTGFSVPACCKNDIKFIKAEYSGFPVLLKSDKPVLSCLPVLFLNPVKIISEFFVSEPVSTPENSPPERGINFIYSIHQIRIPSPVC